MTTEQQLLKDAFKAFRAILAAGSEIMVSQHTNSGLDTRNHDAFWEVRDSSERPGAILVEAFTRFTPRSIDRLTESLSAAKLRRMDHPTVLIVAPWLSVRSRSLIAEQGWSYLDLTGNALIRSYRPAIYVRLPGADNDPNPRDRSQVMLRGSGINALVRLLVDVQPPYRLVDLAAASGLSRGYVSRALTALHEQGLIDRVGGGPVEDVKWADLLRFRATEYDLVRTNRSASYLTRTTAEAILSSLAGDTDTVVTGPYAAAQITPVPADAQLALYVANIQDFARRHALHPARTGANVILVEAASTSQRDRTRIVDGTRHAGYSQLVLDLSGGRRSPMEGEAVLEWLAQTPDWRLPALPHRSPT